MTPLSFIAAYPELNIINSDEFYKTKSFIKDLFQVGCIVYINLHLIPLPRGRREQTTIKNVTKCLKKISKFWNLVTKLGITMRNAFK